VHTGSDCRSLAISTDGTALYVVKLSLQHGDRVSRGAISRSPSRADRHQSGRGHLRRHHGTSLGRGLHRRDTGLQTTKAVVVDRSSTAAPTDRRVLTRRWAVKRLACRTGRRARGRVGAHIGERKHKPLRARRRARDSSSHDDGRGRRRSGILDHSLRQRRRDLRTQRLSLGSILRGPTPRVCVVTTSIAPRWSSWNSHHAGSSSSTVRSRRSA